jgi:hypothetical protein
MRAPRIYLVSVLIAPLTLLAAGQDQTTKAPTVVQGINAADADPKPCNRGGHNAPDAVRDSANKPGLEATSKSPQPLGYGPPQLGIPAVPVNPPTVIFPPGEPEPMTLRDIYWRDLFIMIGLYNFYAEQADKAGKHAEAASLRTSHQRMAGLNDTEGEIMQEIAHDCNCAVKEVDAKMKAEAEKFRAQIAPGATVTASTDFYQLFEERKTTIRDHVDQLRVALGDSSFKKLETYVLSMYPAPKSVAKPAPPTIAPTEKSQK